MSRAASFDLALHPGTTPAKRFIPNKLSGYKQSASRALQLCRDSLTLPFISRAGTGTGITPRGVRYRFLVPEEIEKEQHYESTFKHLNFRAEGKCASPVLSGGVGFPRSLHPRIHGCPSCKSRRMQRTECQRQPRQISLA